jgi:hypothetical protein
MFLSEKRYPLFRNMPHRTGRAKLGVGPGAGIASGAPAAPAVTKSAARASPPVKDRMSDVILPFPSKIVGEGKKKTGMFGGGETLVRRCEA